MRANRPPLLTPDLSVYDPWSGGTTSVVGVISTDAWAGGVSDAITLTAYVSSANRQRLTALAQRSLNNASVTFNFVDDVWDANVKRYYASLEPASPPLRAQLAHNATGGPALQVSTAPGPVQSPQNYAMTMTVNPPSSGQQTIRVASSSSTSAVKAWGVQTTP